MSTSSPPRTPAAGLIAVEWPRPRRPWVRIGAVALALVVAFGAWHVVRGQEQIGLAASAVVTASSVRAASSAHAAVDSGNSAAPRAGWSSDGETVGAWLELSWSETHDLQQVVLVRNPITEPGVTAGFLTFGDGSQLQVDLSGISDETVIPFSARSVDKLRFTASAVSAGAQDVQVAEILVATSADDEVAAGGNAAVDASVTESGSGDPSALTDGAEGAGAVWSTDEPAGSWVQLDWAKPEEIASVELVGAESSSTVRSATVTFGDGARLPVGAVLTDARRPTLVGFMPRVTRSLRLTVDRVDGSGALSLSELRVHRRGATPLRTPTEVAPAPAVADPACAPASAQAGQLVVSCPVAGSAVDGPVPLRISAPGFSGVTATAWPASETDPAAEPVEGTPGPTGAAELTVDVSALPPGPVTVRVEATGGGQEPVTAWFPLYRSGPRAPDVASSHPSAGRTLIYAEEFDRPISLSRNGSGADYTAAKPVDDGVQDFGDAIFADPAQGFDNVRAVDGSLRIDVEPNPPGYTDPQGWGRTHLGGMVASARPGGSGFSAQYGYFEARMLMPAGRGTWPAFWMLPSDNLVAPTKVVAEIDAVEHYGHNPTGACHSTRSHKSTAKPPGTRCGERFDDARAALSWHTYGVSITPTDVTYFIDGRVVAATPQVEGGGAPMFFLVNLALGGGWPVDLGAVQDRATLYVDHIRVYV